VVSFTTQSLYPRGKSPQYPLDRKLGGPQNRSGRRREDCAIWALSLSLQNNNNNNNNIKPNVNISDTEDMNTVFTGVFTEAHHRIHSQHTINIKTHNVIT
jgi:hypothetical protein